MHCIVTGGGLSIDGDWWVGCRASFFVPVRVLKKLFRGKLLAALKAAVKAGELPASHLPDLEELYRKAWVVYCKPPFGSPEQVLAYLARCTHRVAISNSRLVRLDEETVTFTWKGYADHERRREMTLTGEEFLRRFLLHVLPDRFVRIRYYGLFANRHREQALAVCREVLPGPPSRPQPPKTDWHERLQRLTGIDPTRCEVCGEKAMRLVGELAAARRGFLLRGVATEGGNEPSSNERTLGRTHLRLPGSLWQLDLRDWPGCRGGVRIGPQAAQPRLSA